MLNFYVIMFVIIYYFIMNVIIMYQGNVQVLKLNVIPATYLDRGKLHLNKKKTTLLASNFKHV